MKQIVNLGYSLLIVVAGLDGLGHHVWDTTVTALPRIPRLLQVKWEYRFMSLKAFRGRTLMLPVFLGSRNCVYSCYLASKIIIAIPADTHLHAYEVWTDLLGLSHLNLGQLGILLVHFVPHHLRV